MDALPLNYWLSKFVMELAKKSGKGIVQRLCMALYSESNATLKRRVELKD